MAVSFKGAPFPPEGILRGSRWYLAYPLSTRHLEALMEKRGVSVDHATLHRRVVTDRLQLQEECHRRKQAVWVSGRMDETLDVLLTKPRDKAAARCCLNKAMGRHGLPDKITMDGSKAPASAIKGDHDDHGTSTKIRQTQSLPHRVEQDHQGVKRVARPRLGFPSFDAAQATFTGIERVRMIRKDEIEGNEVEGLSAAEKFNALAW